MARLKAHLKADLKFNLLVSLSGLCGFVPKYDGSQMWALMVDEHDPKNRKLEPHKAVLRFSLLDLIDSTNANTPEGTGLWDLSKFNLTIVTGNPDPEPLHIVGFESQSPTDDAFVHIASIEDAAKGRGFSGAGTVRPEFISPKMKLSDGEPLAARLLMTEGTISVATLASGVDDNNKSKFAVFRFRPFKGKDQKDDHRQLVASEVLLQLGIFADYVEIQARKFGDENIADTLRLRPVTPGKPVSIAIMNEEGGQITGTSRRKGIKIKKARQQDRIFASFYRLASVPPGTDEVPIPVADFLTERGRAPIAVLAPPCSPGRYTNFE